jgi:hypothetical protein
MQIETFGTNKVVVTWPEGYTFGDSWPHAQGKFAAANALGYKASTTRLKVADAKVVDGRVIDTVWIIKDKDET